MSSPKKEKFVLDTSIFVNPDTQQEFAGDIDTAVESCLAIAEDNGLGLYMPTSVFTEMGHFVSESTQKKFRSSAVVKTVDLHGIDVPAAVLHSFIKDLRARINNGLRITERAIRSENIPDNIRRVRERYRTALRSGIVDSVEDLDVVLMAREVDGKILTADQGIISMAEEMGIEIFSAEDFTVRYKRKGGDE